MAHYLRIGILVERRYLAQAQPAGVTAALQARGHQVMLIDPEVASYEMGDDGWLADLDLILPRGRSWALLSLLAWAESRGTPVLNGRAAIAAVHNKAEMAVALAAGDVPTPSTFLGPVEYLASRVPGGSYPLILKPIFGDNGQGLRVVHTPHELAGVKWPEPVALAQQYLPGDSYDLKLYGIGDDFWAVRKPSQFHAARATVPRGPASPGPQAERLPVTPALRELGRRCRDLFGLELYGVDCLQTPGGPVVIEVNDFPNYTGVSEADERLAHYVIRRAEELGASRGRES